MIQRIQSVYLFIAVVALAAMFFFPLSVHSFRGLTIPFELLEKVSDTELAASMMITIWPLIVGVLVLIALGLITLFSYRNRQLQMRLVMASVLLNIVIIIAEFWMAKHLASKLDPQAVDMVVEYSFGAYLPVVSLLFFILAHRGIKRDEQKVRAADRLR